MDYHEDLKLPAEALAQIAEDAPTPRADPFGVRQIELYHNRKARCTACSKGPARTPTAATNASAGGMTPVPGTPSHSEER